MGKILKFEEIRKIDCTFLAWRKLKMEKIWKFEEIEKIAKYVKLKKSTLTF